MDIQPAPSFQQPALFPPKLTRLERLEAIHTAAVAREEERRRALPVLRRDTRYPEPPSAITALLIEACALAYHPSTTIHQALATREFEHITCFYTCDIQSPPALAGTAADPRRKYLRAFGFSDGQHAYVVFRGSDYLQDWLINAQLWMTGRPGRHAGFESAWKAVSGEILKWLRQPEMAPRPVFVAGHSLGGAVAVIGALAIAEAGGTIGGIVTVGQPRVGGSAFSQAFLGLQERGGPPLVRLVNTYIHDRDPVPAVLPRWLGFSDVKTPTPITFEALFPALRQRTTVTPSHDLDDEPTKAASSANTRVAPEKGIPKLTDQEVALAVAQGVIFILSWIPGSTGLLAVLFSYANPATRSAVEAASDHPSIGYVCVLSPGRLLGDTPRRKAPPKPGKLLRVLCSVGAASLILGVIVSLGHLLGGGRLLRDASLMLAGLLTLLAMWNLLRGRAAA